MDDDCFRSLGKTLLARTAAPYISGFMPDPVGVRPTAFASVLRAALNIVVFLAVLIAVCAAIQASLPVPDVSGISQKRLYFQKHKDRYDVVFIGSSRFFHQVIPKQFDDRVKQEGGGEVRAFNFGLDGMWPPESFYILRQLLAMKPAHLRWVLIDGMDINARSNETEMATRRFSYWHDARHTWMAWQKVADLPLSLEEKWTLWSRHAEVFARRGCNEGEGATWLEAELGLVKKKKADRWDPPSSWKDTEGYETEPDVALAGEARAKFESLAGSIRKNFTQVPISPAYREALEKIVTEIRAAGAQPILVLTPTMNPRERFTGFPADLPIWSYQNMDEFPALYEPANHFDEAHLNHAGAQIFTDLLATRFAEMVKAKR